MNIRSRLAVVNGRRRIRLLDIDDIKGAAKDLLEGEHEFLHAGHVANAYKYPATATGAVVWRDAGGCWAIIREVNARKGCTGFGHRKSWKPDCAGDAVLV